MYSRTNKGALRNPAGTVDVIAKAAVRSCKAFSASSGLASRRQTFKALSGAAAWPRALIKTCLGKSWSTAKQSSTTLPRRSFSAKSSARWLCESDSTIGLAAGVQRRSDVLCGLGVAAAVHHCMQRAPLLETDTQIPGIMRAKTAVNQANGNVRWCQFDLRARGLPCS